MLAYIARRILLMIPTIFGIMLVSFAIMQFVPGGPVERAIAQLQGLDEGSTARFGGGGGQIGSGRRRPCGRRHLLALPGRAGARSQIHQGAGEAIRLRQAGLRALPHPGQGLFDVQSRPQLFPRRAGAEPHQGEAARLDLARPLDDLHLLCDLDPARHQEGGLRRLALRYLDLGRRHLRLRDPELPLRRAARRPLLRRLVLACLPVSRTDLRQFRRSLPGRRRFSTTSGTSPCR